MADAEKFAYFRTSTAWQKFLAGSACPHSCAGRNPSSGDPLDSRLRGNDRPGASSRITAEGLPPLCTRAGSFQAQYWSVVRQAGDDCLVFFQLGRFIEFYGPQRLAAAPVLRLKTALISRAGYAFTVGFPTRLSGAYTVRAIKQGRTVVEVREVREVPMVLSGSWLRRLPCAVVIPTSQRPDQIASWPQEMKNP